MTKNKKCWICKRTEEDLIKFYQKTEQFKKDKIIEGDIIEILPQELEIGFDKTKIEIYVCSICNYYIGFVGDCCVNYHEDYNKHYDIDNLKIVEGKND